MPMSSNRHLKSYGLSVSLRDTELTPVIPPGEARKIPIIVRCDVATFCSAWAVVSCEARSLLANLHENKMVRRIYDSTNKPQKFFNFNMQLLTNDSICACMITRTITTPVFLACTQQPRLVRDDDEPEQRSRAVFPETDEALSNKKTELVPFRSLFRFASAFDWFCIMTAMCSSFVVGYAQVRSRRSHALLLLIICC